MAHLALSSIQQLLAVLDSTRRSHSRGIPMPRAYQDAVRDVSRRYSVTYQTIGDFRRRLGFSDVNQYRHQIDRWLRGDPEPMRRTLTAHADDAATPIINRFFDPSDSTNGAASVHRLAIPSAARTKSGEVQLPQPVAIQELRLRITPELRNRIRLAHLAQLGPTVEETAITLLESGFDVEKERIKRFLEEL